MLKDKTSPLNPLSKGEGVGCEGFGNLSHTKTPLSFGEGLGVRQLPQTKNAIHPEGILNNKNKKV